jgi:hypothetical protein
MRDTKTVGAGFALPAGAASGAPTCPCDECICKTCVRANGRSPLPCDDTCQTCEKMPTVECSEHPEANHGR